MLFFHVLPKIQIYFAHTKYLWKKGSYNSQERPITSFITYLWYFPLKTASPMEHILETTVDHSNNKTLHAFWAFHLSLTTPSSVLPRDIWSCNQVRKAPSSCVLPFRPERFHVVIKINVLWHPLGFLMPWEQLMKKYNLCRL